jgi:hypothetical protein
VKKAEMLNLNHNEALAVKSRVNAGALTQVKAKR